MKNPNTIKIRINQLKKIIKKAEKKLKNDGALNDVLILQQNHKGVIRVFIQSTYSEEFGIQIL